MIEIVFDKHTTEYSININLSSRVNDNISMKLDTGSPISVICVQNLKQITQEPWSKLVEKIDSIKDDKDNILHLGVYGNSLNHLEVQQDDDKNKNKYRDFIPYVIKDIVIGGQKIPCFIFWVDVTNYKDRSEITSTLFGFDNMCIGEKWFDDNDNFHIKVNELFNQNIFRNCKEIN